MLDLQRVDAEEFRKMPKMPLTVVLDDVRSEMNVGSIFRTSDAFCVQEVLLCGITSTPPKPEIHKTALGAEDSVEWQHFSSVIEAIAHLHNQGYTVLAVEQVHGSVSLETFTPEANKKYAVVLGNEVKGVAQTAVDACDGCIEVPQGGTKHSLNVACTASIILWKFYESFLCHK